MNATLKAIRLADDRTMLVDKDMQPQLVQLMTRPSKKYPTRTKAMLAIPVDDDDDRFLPLPYGSGPIMTAEFVMMEQN